MRETKLDQARWCSSTWAGPGAQLDQSSHYLLNRRHTSLLSKSLLGNLRSLSGQHGGARGRWKALGRFRGPLADLERSIWKFLPGTP